ncbi:hypothetical protein KAW80_02260 [Candidatus Babeliales bacterium]|nr:hypothetical protein [Candidatus Babeliales bacterium]
MQIFGLSIVQNEELVKYIEILTNTFNPYRVERYYISEKHNDVAEYVRPITPPTIDTHHDDVKEPEIYRNKYLCCAIL